MKKVLYILGKLSDADIEWMVAQGDRKVIAAGATLIEEGKPTQALYFILDGGFTVSARGKALAGLGSGEVVGELSFLDSRPPAATVTASERSSVLAIAKPDLAAKLKKDEGFASRFYHALGVFLATRLRSTMSGLGFGGGEKLDEDKEYADEIEGDLLDDVSLAGARFDWLIRRMQGA